MRCQKEAAAGYGHPAAALHMLEHGNCLVFCPNSSVKFWLRLFAPCFSHFFARCAASNSKIASPDPKIHYPKFNELLVENTKCFYESEMQHLSGRLCTERAFGANTCLHGRHRVGARSMRLRRADSCKCSQRLRQQKSPCKQGARSMAHSRWNTIADRP